MDRADRKERERRKEKENKEEKKKRAHACVCKREKETLAASEGSDYRTFILLLEKKSRLLIK